MTMKEATKMMIDIKEHIRFYGSVDDICNFLRDQGIEYGLRGAYKKRYLEIWSVKGETRMRISILSENTYYALCAVIKNDVYSQLKLEL